MIITEYYTTRQDGVELCRTYSNNNKMIYQNETGVVYSEAIDIMPCAYTYNETDMSIGMDAISLEEE